jgi:transcriptional regulator with XRE-family HTH domain
MALMTEFGEYLRRRRAELQPGDVGLPHTAFRRVAGLRREEVAQLAGVSTDYYTRLEQGRDLSPSDAVLDALARALELDDAGRAHLYHVAHPARPGRRPIRTVQRVRPAVQSMLDAWTGQAAFVLGRRGDVLATNPLARALLADFDAMPYRDRNLTKWILLDPAARELYVDWAQIASEMVAILRLGAGAHPDDARTTELVGEFTLKSPEFSRWWSQHKVLDRTWGHKRFRHPVVGPSRSITGPSTCPATPTRRCSCTERPTATLPPPTHSSSSRAGTLKSPPRVSASDNEGGGYGQLADHWTRAPPQCLELKASG